MRTSYRRDLFSVVLAFVLVLSSVSFASAQEQKGVKIENGVISFPEADTPSVNMKDLKFSFPADSPGEILGIQGKIFGKKLHREEICFLSMKILFPIIVLLQHITRRTSYEEIMCDGTREAPNDVSTITMKRKQY